MSLEKNQRQTVIKALAPLKAFSVENLVGSGTPDVFFVGGCLELKSIDQWPGNGILNEGVDYKHFTAQQRLFARLWRRAGGFHCVCLQVGRDWFLLEGGEAADHLGVDWTRGDIIGCAWKAWRDRLNHAEFLDVIKKATQLKKKWKP